MNQPEDVVVRGRKLLTSLRITTEYAPVLSEALKELERVRDERDRIAAELVICRLEARGHD